MRKFVVLIAALAVLPLAASAQTVIPSNINLHNGYIVVRNEVRADPQNALDLRIRNLFGGVVDSGTAAPGATILLNKCCFAAGSEYKVTGYGMSIPVRPQLCNVRGIPFGYAVVVYTGRIYYTHGNPIAIAEIDPAVPHVSCPVDPPNR